MSVNFTWKIAPYIIQGVKRSFRSQSVHFIFSLEKKTALFCIRANSWDCFTYPWGPTRYEYILFAYDYLCCKIACKMLSDCNRKLLRGYSRGSLIKIHTLLFFHPVKHELKQTLSTYEIIFS